VTVLTIILALTTLDTKGEQNVKRKKGVENGFHLKEIAKSYTRDSFVSLK
jgi:hypothetical protein